jgi:hypothetical protein
LLAFQTAQGTQRNAFAIGDAHFGLGDFQSLTPSVARRRRGDAARSDLILPVTGRGVTPDPMHQRRRLDVRIGSVPVFY